MGSPDGSRIFTLKLGGWKTKAIFSRYNVPYTEGIRKATALSGQYVPDRIAEAQAAR
jgi:hypothetical protein